MSPFYRWGNWGCRGFLLEQPLRQIRETPSKLWGQVSCKQKNLGVLGNLERKGHLCVPQSVDFGARRASREKGMMRAFSRRKQ